MDISRMVRQGLVFLLLGLCTTLSLVFAQGENIRFSHLTIEDGLSQSSVYCILQDEMGFMWFGTEAGLNKYDGYNFKIFLSDVDDANSLTNNYILSLCRDRTGMFWIGTERGLNLLDARKENFIRFLHQPDNGNSLSHNRVFVVYEDQAGEIWVGTENGLNRYVKDKNQFQRYLAQPGSTSALNNANIRVIHQDRAGIFWIGTYGGGLNRFDPGSNQFTHFVHDEKDTSSISDNYVLAIFEDQKGILWIGTENGGLNRFDRDKMKFKQYRNIANNPDSISDNHVNAVYEDSTGKLWVGTNDNGVNRFDRDREIFIRYQNNPDDPASLSSNRILSIFEDSTGGLWFGNYGGALNIYNKYTQKFVHYQTEPNNPNSLSYNDIRPIYEDKNGILWIGTDGEGLNRFDRKRGRFTHFKYDPNRRHSISDNRVFALCEDYLGILWVGTNGGGLNRFDRSSNKFIRYQADPSDPGSISDNRIRVLLEDHLNILWIGTNGGGLDRFDRRTGQFMHHRAKEGTPGTLSNDRIYALSEDREGNLWIGTFGGGLNILDTDRKQFSRFTNDPKDEKSISSDFVLSICQDQIGDLWVGTLGGGINSFDFETKRFQRFTDKDGLPDNTIYDVLEDDKGNLWMATNKGLSKMDPKMGTFKNYDVKDGLQSNEFNTGAAYKSRRGEMFFGGIGGFNSFFPDQIRDNPFKPNIVITSFQLFNKPVPIGKEVDGRVILEQSITVTDRINLSYRDKSLTFEFAALHFASPDKNQYAYKMEGFDPEWNMVGNRRFVTYTGLPPKEYVFRVRGSNNDGVWNETGTSLQIVIAPPFWQTTWFYTLVGLFALLLTVTIYRLRVRQLKIRKGELEKLVKERTSQLAEANVELEKLSIVARETDNAVVIMDASGKYEWFNEGYTRMFQYTLPEWIEAHGDNILQGSANPDIKEVLQQCLVERSTITYESEGTTRSGRTLWTQTTLTPILDDSGEVKKLIAIDSDISKIKEAEMTAERANQSKSEFLARMSHEIRTPMNGVIGFSDMLLDTDLTAEQIDYARTISRSGEALISLLNDILDFSKIEAGELTIHPIDFDPEITVFDVCDIISPRIGTKRIELICHVGDTVPAFIKGDAGRFRQVIINLMGNAAKFTEEGEIELSLMVAEEMANRYKLHVRVRDTGIGIPAEKLDSVFDVFQQADGSTTRKYGGTGLGLTICKQISNLMGGDVWVESEEGIGSTFHFTCWMDRSGKEVEPQPAYDYLEGKRALIVDDHSTNLDILSHVLTRSGMEVIPLKRPEKVIPELKKQFAAKTPVDICIIDIQMPRSSGYDVAQEIRRLESPMHEIPLLAYSSSTLSRSRKYKESGFDGYLPKPIHRKKLLKMVARLLGRVEDEEEEKKETIVTQHSIIEETKHSVRILLAEDNAINMKLALFMLQKAGYQVTVAKNGEEAIDIFTRNPDRFDLILMDIQMPKVDGKEATRILREKGFKDIPIVAMTAESMKGDREKCLESGMDDYISKPIRREVVFKIVKKWCLDK